MGNQQKYSPGSGTGKKIILVAVIVVCALALGYISLSHISLPDLQPLPNMPGGSSEAPGENTRAPDFTVEDAWGNEVRLSEFKGKVVIINFWSVTCPACLLELEGLERLAAKMSGKPFELMAVTMDSKRTVKSFMRDTSLDIPVYFDTTQQAHVRYGVFGLPVTYIITPEGTVDTHILGAADWGHHTVVEYLEKLIPKSHESEVNSRQNRE